MGRKIFLIFCIVHVLLSCSKRENVTIKKVEHFYVSSNNARTIFIMLTEQFDLPIVWNYQDWGNFKSGGVTLGNVVIELIESKSTQNQKYYGVALEPSHSLIRILPSLDSARIAHGNISKAADWSTMSLTNILPNDINLFLCDYHDRESVTLNRERAVNKLFKNGGGTLGIQYLQTIIIGTEDPIKYEENLIRIPGIIKKEKALKFPLGPNLELAKSDTPFFSLLIKVQSIDKAKLALEALHLKTQITEQGVEILDEVLPTKITLFE